MLPRIIPILLLKSRGLFKGKNFQNHKYVGDPINAVKIFNEKRANEIMLLDISAGLENRILDIDFIQSIADETYMPFSVGGGLKSVAEIEKCIQHGAEKVVLNTSVILNPALIKEASSIFGSQAISVAIDYQRSWGRIKVFTSAGTKATNLNVIDWAQNVEDLGAGEVILNNIDNEGSYLGFDCGMVEKTSSKINIPLVAGCGAGSLADIRDVVNAGASAVGIGSMFIFRRPHNAVLISYPDLHEIESLFN